MSPLSVRGLPSPAAAAAFLVLAGCSDAPSGAGAPGLTPALPEAVLEPELRIDGYEEDLVPIGATALHPDGRLAFTQFQDGVLALYGADGARTSAVGGLGDGPGEFRYPHTLGFVADTLWVWDSRHRRITWIALTPQPELLRVESVSGAAATGAPETLPAFGRVTPLAVYPDGTIFARGSDPQGPGAEAAYGTSVYLRVTPDGEVVHPVARVPRPSGLITVSRDLGDGQTTGVGVPLPWVIGTPVVSGGDARTVAIVRTEVDPDAPTATIGVTRLDQRDTTWTTALRLRAHPITKSRADSAIEDRVRRISDRTQADWRLRDEFRRRATTPPVVPPVADAIVGADGSVWIGLAQVPDYPDGTWLVLDGEGRPAVSVTLPEGSRELLQATRDVAWVSEADSLGVESLVRYRLGR